MIQLALELQRLASDALFLNTDDKNFSRLIFADILELIEKREEPGRHDLLTKTGFLGAPIPNAPFASLASKPRPAQYFYQLLHRIYREGRTFSEEQLRFMQEFLLFWAQQSMKAEAA